MIPNNMPITLAIAVFLASVIAITYRYFNPHKQDVCALIDRHGNGVIDLMKHINYIDQAMIDQMEANLEEAKKIINDKNACS